jgi:NAD(P)-dependent dehydrogenase (short-subunit alcohol dehydrogenase family)
MTGRRVLVVGGGQNDFGLDDPPLGNGRATCTLLAREGAAVAVADIDAGGAEATARLVRDAGGQAATVVADASDEDSSARMFEEAAAALGGLDGVVMNVGIGAGSRLRGTSARDWDLVMAVNLRSHFLGAKHGIAHMREGGGAIVLIGSIAAREVMPVPAYAASKAALESLCRQASAEGAPSVRANLLHPGLIDTPIGRAASQANPARGRALIPARRQGTAWEIAYGVLYLLGEESSYVTGHTLVVDGGLTSGPRG